MKLTSKERATLRGEAHHLKAMVHVGHHGVTDTVRESIDDVLRTRELVKIQLGRLDDVKPKQLAGELAAQLGAEVVQVIGKTLTLFRENPDLPRTKGDEPPWRQ